MRGDIEDERGRDGEKRGRNRVKGERVEGRGVRQWEKRQSEQRDGGREGDSERREMSE